MSVKRASTNRRSGGAKLTRAKIRHFIFTVAPNRLTRGLLKRRHLDQPVELRELTLHVPSWPKQWEGLRIAHVSDFHLGELMPMPKALEIMERVAKAKPDLLACTGDVVDLEWRGAGALLEAMGAVKAPLGNYLVLGNHDHLDDPLALSRAARRRGLIVLNDVVERAGAHELRVGGIDWGRTKRELSTRLATLPERPDLLLSHNPKAFPAAAKLGVPLTLAGHTHGGQVGLPDRSVKRSMRPAVEDHAEHGAHSVHGSAADLGTNAANEHLQQHESIKAAPARARSRALRAGLYAEGDSRLFVNVGAGSWFPARLNCPAEIVMLTIAR